MILVRGYVSICNIAVVSYDGLHQIVVLFMFLCRSLISTLRMILKD